MMVEEIGRRAGQEAGGGAAGGAAGGTAASPAAAAGATGREGYALAAGLALGLVVLGTGRSAPGLSDLQLDRRLM